jgi:hypothetical protein
VSLSSQPGIGQDCFHTMTATPAIDDREADGKRGPRPPTGPSEGRSQASYVWMAVAAFMVIAAGKTLLPFVGQQRAQNISLAIEALVGAAVGLGAFKLFCGRSRGK